MVLVSVISGALVAAGAYLVGMAIFLSFPTVTGRARVVLFSIGVLLAFAACTVYVGGVIEHWWM